MADVTHMKIEEIDAIGGFDRLSMRRVAAGLGVSSFGISIEEFGSGADEYPEHIVRVGPGAKRKIVAGSEGLRLLALGGRPGEAYDTGGTL